MAQVYFDRVQETGSSGLADFSLGGAVSGYQAFGTVCSNGDTVSYCAVLTTQWEVGLGTYNAGVLERTTVQDSSTGGSKVNFSGSPAVFLTWSGVDAANSGGGGGTGDVVGPASSVDSRVALFDGITGKLLKQSSAVLGTAAFAATGAFDASGAAAAAQAASQPVDADLTTIAGLTATTDNVIQSKAGAWASRSVAQYSVDLQATGLIADAVGFRTIPQNSQSTAYTTVAADSGKHIYHPGADTTARIWTIDSNANVAYPIGTAITFVNDTLGGVITIAITADTLVLAGAGTTGSRTLAASGVATAVKMTSTRWMISGTGLT